MPKLPNLHHVLQLRKKIIAALQKYKTVTVNKVFASVIARDLSNIIHPQQADHTREEDDVSNLKDAIHQSVVNITGGMTLDDEAINTLAIRISGLRDRVILCNPVGRFFYIEFDTVCHAIVVSIEPNPRMLKYVAEIEVLDGIASGERVTLYMSKKRLVYVMSKIGLYNKRRPTKIDYTELMGKYMIVCLSNRSDALSVTNIIENDSIKARNKKEGNANADIRR